MRRLKFITLILLAAFAFSCTNQRSISNSSTDINRSATTIRQNRTDDKSKIKPHEDYITSSSEKSEAQGETKIQSTEKITDLLEKLEKAPQIFSIYSNRDTTLICSEGTRIKIKRNSFVSEVTGKEITGQIVISVKEYYKISDILYARLSTTSDNNILETGGMVNIFATSNNENSILKKGETIEIGFPFSQKKENMELFTGKWTNDKVNWKLNQTADINPDTSSEEIFSIVEQMSYFPGGETALNNYIKQNAQYPFSALDKKVQGTVYVTLVINKYGAITNVGILRGINPSLDKVAFRLVSNMPAWVPGRQRNIPVATQYNVPINFSLSDIQITPALIEKSKLFEQQIANVKVVYGNPAGAIIAKSYNDEIEKIAKDSTLANTDPNLINYYFFRTSNLGWLNTDRFAKINGPILNFTVDVSESTDAYVTAVFHSMKAKLYSAKINNKYIFSYVPSGEKITIVAIKKVNAQTFLAIKETTTTAKSENNLSFEPVTLQQLDDAIKKLDVLH